MGEANEQIIDLDSMNFGGDYQEEEVIQKREEELWFACLLFSLDLFYFNQP